MKHTSMMLLLMGLTLWGCSEKKSSKSTNTTTATPVSQPTTTSPACIVNPYSADCINSGGAGTGTSPYQVTIPKDNNWTAKYPNGEPQGTCSGTTGSGFEPRKGTVTVAGGQMYSPANPWSQDGSVDAPHSYSHNVSWFLTNVNDAKSFFDHDSTLKARFKVRPQYKVSGSRPWCFGRQTTGPVNTYGYTALQYSVSLREVNADGSLGLFKNTQTFTTSVNSCSGVANFPGYGSSANGVVLVIHDVKSQDCWYGTGCTSYGTPMPTTCWSMDIEVAVDGTKSFVQ